MQVPNGTGPGVRRRKRPLLASRTRCNVLSKPPKFGNKEIDNKVQFGNKFYLATSAGVGYAPPILKTKICQRAVGVQTKY